jgi:hypothetical protein
MSPSVESRRRPLALSMSETSKFCYSASLTAESAKLL